MTEPTKHRNVPKRRAGDPAKPSPTSQALAWLRTTPGLIVAAVLLLVLAFVLRLVVSGDDKPAATGSHGPGSSSAAYGNEWTTIDGYSYEISVQSLRDQVAVGSASGCIATPRAGQTNLHFLVTITNKSKKSAPVPVVFFASNLRPNGTVARKVLTYPQGNKAVELVPLKAKTCAQGSRLGPTHRDAIPAGGKAVFTGTFGPTSLPLPAGITMIVRYFTGDPAAPSRFKAADFLAPFGGFVQ
jgi:hypothetical protein